MSRLLAELLLQDEQVEKEWDESLHPRDSSGRFGHGGGRPQAAPSVTAVGWTQGGADPKALARVAVARARALGEGTKTLAREAARAAIRAGAGKETKIRAAAVARAAVRREVGGAHMKRPEQAAELKQRFGAGRARGGNNPPVVKPGIVNPPPAKPLPPPPPGHGGAAPRPVGADELAEHKLKTDEIVSAKLKKDQNVNDTWFVKFKDGTEGVFKPTSSGRMRGNITPGKDKEREEAAWQVAKIVGMQDMVPPTVIVKTDSSRLSGTGVKLAGAEGSMQRFMPNTNKAANDIDAFDGGRAFARAAVFDYVIGHEDRHEGNWLVGQTDKKLTLIDHGLSFPESTKIGAVRGFMAVAPREGQTIQPGRYGYVPQRVPDIPGSPADYSHEYVQNKSAILNELSKLNLPQSAIKGTSERIDHLAAAKDHSDWHKMATGDLSQQQPAGPQLVGGKRQSQIDFENAIRALLMGGGRRRR